MNKRINISKSVIIAVFIFSSLGLISSSRADAPRVGRKAAQKYFEEGVEKTRQVLENYNILMLHLGQYIDSQAYEWGPSAKVDGAGAANYGVTYLLDEWHGLDANIRVDFSEYNISNNRAVKISFLPLVTFPRADSRFPLYFGVGGGLGVFMQQISNKSNLSFDYQLIMGARFTDISPGFGAFVEYGLKNHLHLLSNGQFNGTILTGGAVFTF